MANAGTFTAQTARKAAILAVAARRAKANRPPDPPEPVLEPIKPAEDPYCSNRLACVRAQIALIDAAILKEASKSMPDGQRLNWLASAQERLAEQERLLAGRPLPGSHKPITPKVQAPRPSTIEPLYCLPPAPDVAPKESLLPAPTVPTTPTPTPAAAPPARRELPPTSIAGQFSGSLPAAGLPPSVADYEPTKAAIGEPAAGGKSGAMEML